MTTPSLFELDAKEPSELLPYDGSALLYRKSIDRGRSNELMDQLLDEVPWQQPSLRIFGREVAQPRLVAWFGDPDDSYGYSGLTLAPNPWLESLSEIRSICQSLAGIEFNSALANLYRDGSDSVAWHADDEPELGSDPVIASVSLGSERRFDLRHRRTNETIKTVLPSASIVIMANGCQKNWLHQIPKQLRIKEPRINLTFRRFG